MLYAGKAKVDITPVRPTPLAGYGFRFGKGPYEGISSPIYARVMCLRHVPDATPAGLPTTALLVSADLLWWGSERMEQLKSRIREIWPADFIILNATHSHSGPTSSEMFSVMVGEIDPEYLPYLEEKLLEGIREAAGGMEPVTVERGRGACDIAKNRRKYRSAETDTWVSSDQPIDRELTVLRYAAADGRTFAIVNHYACHPVTNTKNLLSAEFPGASADLLEEELGNGAICLFLQGTCGDIDPSDGNDFYYGGEEEVRYLGKKFAGAVRQVLQSPMERLADIPLAGQDKSIVLPLQPIPDRSALEESVSEEGLTGEWSRKLLERPELLRPFRIVEATLLVLAEDVALLAMNGEIVSHYGLYIKGMTHKAVLPLGYSNGMIGYVPTSRQLDEGGYEPITSTPYFMLPAPFAHDAEANLKEGLYELLDDHGLIKHSKGDIHGTEYDFA